jgi:hypothetical protein
LLLLFSEVFHSFLLHKLVDVQIVFQLSIKVELMQIIIVVLDLFLGFVHRIHILLVFDANESFLKLTSVLIQLPSPLHFLSLQLKIL